MDLGTDTDIYIARVGWRKDGRLTCQVLSRDQRTLRAVLSESLRLHPVVPSHMHRKTPPEGIRVEGVWIPGDMTVMCPQYVLGRCMSFAFTLGRIFGICRRC